MSQGIPASANWSGRVKAFRSTRGWSLSTTARFFGVAKGTIHALETGLTRLPSLHLREAIIAAEVAAPLAWRVRFVSRDDALFECVVLRTQGDYITGCGIGVGRDATLAYWSARREISLLPSMRRG